MTFAGFAKQILSRDRAVGENQRAGRRAANPELVLLRADREPRRVALHQKRRKSARRSIFAKTMKRSAKPAFEIHIFSPFRMYCLPSGESRAWARMFIASEPDDGLGERIGGDPFPGRELRQVLFLLRWRPVPDHRQRANPRVRAEAHREAGRNRDAIRDQRRRDLVEREAAVLLRDIDRHQPQLARFQKQLARDREVFRLDFGHPRQDRLLREFRSGPRDLLLLFREVFRCEDVFRRGIREKETAADGGLACGYSGHG